jgi:hypothetical protein
VRTTLELSEEEKVAPAAEQLGLLVKVPLRLGAAESVIGTEGLQLRNCERSEYIRKSRASEESAKEEVWGRC